MGTGNPALEKRHTRVSFEQRGPLSSDQDPGANKRRPTSELWGQWEPDDEDTQPQRAVPVPPPAPSPAPGAPGYAPYGVYPGYYGYPPYYAWQPIEPKRDGFHLAVSIISLVGSILAFLGGLASAFILALFLISTSVNPASSVIKGNQYFS